MDKKRIEAISVNAVRAAFDSVEEVNPLINENDKKPCIDGSIEVYRSNAMTKENLIGDIFVQIKGTEAKRKSNNPKRRVEVIDLRKYLDIYHGVLYFCVFIKNPGKVVSRMLV